MYDIVLNVEVKSMPMLIYMINRMGRVSPAVIHEHLWTGNNTKKKINNTIMQVEITEEEARLGLDELMRRYPCEITKTPDRADKPKDETNTSS